MSLEHILLGLLRDPASGYDLRLAFDDGPRHFWSARLSQIYPTLQRMEERGWLKSKDEPSGKGPPRRVYRRTGSGTRVLYAWLRAEPEMGVDRLAYIGQLVFLAELADLDRTRRFLEVLRDGFRVLRDDLAASEGELREVHPRTPSSWDDDAFHELLCVRLGVGGVEGKLAACEACLDLVRARQRLQRRRSDG